MAAGAITAQDRLARHVAKFHVYQAARVMGQVAQGEWFQTLVVATECTRRRRNTANTPRADPKAMIEAGSGTSFVGGSRLRPLIDVTNAPPVPPGISLRFCRNAPPVS